MEKTGGRMSRWAKLLMILSIIFIAAVGLFFIIYIPLAIISAFMSITLQLKIRQEVDGFRLLKQTLVTPFYIIYISIEKIVYFIIGT